MRRPDLKLRGPAADDQSDGFVDKFFMRFALRDDTALFTAYEEFQGFDTAIAEKNLMRAILRSAIEDMKKRGEYYRQARSFFLSENDSYIYSFLSICRHLGLSCEAVRNYVGLTVPFEFQRLAA